MNSVTIEQVRALRTELTMYRKRRYQSRRCGFVMGLMVVALIVLLITGVGLLSLGSHRRIFSVQTCSGIGARSAADAGLTKALFEMNEKLNTKPWIDSNLPLATNESLPGSDAVFSYKVTGDRINGYTIVSVGKQGLVTKKVVGKLGLEGPFDTALFGNELISLKTGTTIDGYNYTLPDECVKIGTNSILPSRVIARTGVTIFGDVFVGPDGDPDVVIDSRNDSVITGEVYALDEAFPLPPVEVPLFLQNLSSIGSITNSIILTGPTRCDTINLSDKKTLLINGPVDLYCTGNFTLDILSNLVIADANTNPNAYLNLYLDGDFTIKNSSLVNNDTQDPRKFKIYGLDKCLNFQFMIDSTFYGAIYAPNANVILQYAVEMYGATICRQISQQIAAGIHYDALLKEGCVSDEMVTFVVKQWSEEDIPAVVTSGL